MVLQIIDFSFNYKNDRTSKSNVKLATEVNRVVLFYYFKPKT